MNNRISYQNIFIICFLLLAVLPAGCGGDDGNARSASLLRTCGLQHESEGLNDGVVFNDVISLRLESATSKTPHRNDTGSSLGTDMLVFSAEEGETFQFFHDHNDTISLRLLDLQGEELGAALPGESITITASSRADYILELNNSSTDTPVILIPEKCSSLSEKTERHKADPSSTGIQISSQYPITIPGVPEDDSKLNEYIKETCLQILQFYIFQENNSETWSSVKAAFTSFASYLYKSGKLKGNTESNSYAVLCGHGLTMTDHDILNGYLRVQLQLAIEQPAEFIVFTASTSTAGY